MPVYSHSCPEIGFALSQLSHFTFNPKHSHELVFIHLGQCLQHSLNEGMVLRPMRFDEFQMEAHADLDFMGLYGHERRDDPDNMRSRAGYVILLNGCPIAWKTKLQEGVSTSTMMAECYALSTSMHEALPLCNLITAVGTGFGLDGMVNTTFKCTSQEDNTRCKMLANLEPDCTTPRSRFYENKVHWFRSVLSKTITMIWCATVDQLADINTKLLPREQFE